MTQPKKIPIFIDKQKFELGESTANGNYLIGLLPVPDGFDLWQEAKGHEDDIRIEPGKDYDIKPGDHFYTAKSELGPGSA